MRRKITVLFLITLLLFVSSFNAAAEEFDQSKKGSVSVTLTEQGKGEPIVGAELDLYYVASLEDVMTYVYTENFEAMGIAVNDANLVAALDEFVVENSIECKKLVTDSNGFASISDLDLGLYFVRQTNLVDGFAPCKPFVVTIPTKEGDDFVYDVNASPKTEVLSLVSITIKKAWNTAPSAKLPESVTVQLLNEGKVVETAILSEENNWQITYTNMPKSDAYSIKEISVPKGYTATYSKSESIFTVTNTPSLVQTGQLVWPIPVLAAVGVLLIGVGFICLRKKRKTNA